MIELVPKIEFELIKERSCDDLRSVEDQCTLAPQQILRFFRCKVLGLVLELRSQREIEDHRI